MRSRRTSRRAAVVAALPWTLMAALRVTGTERGFPLVPALSFTPHAAVSVVLPLFLAIRARSVPGALLSAAACAGLAPAVLARLGHRRGAGPAALVGGAAGGGLPPAVLARRGHRRDAPPTGERLRVATVSLRRGEVAAEPVLKLVRGHRVDVLAVQELTPRAHVRLCGAGLADLLPHGHVIPARPGSVEAASGAVWSRRPLRKRSVVPGQFEQPTVRLATDGGPDVEVTAVHTFPPATSPAAVRRWTGDLAALPGPVPEVLRVLAGDFNATADHAAFRAVLGQGYRDAAREAGRALTWTWRPLRLRFPRLVLDHVLTDPRVGVASVELVDVASSDHRALVAELVLPGR